MANRVIRDSIYSSPSLARLSREAAAWFPWWVLMADDWGCFNADPDVIKGAVYPKRKDVGIVEVEGWLVEYHNNHQLFIWVEGERIWGFFTAFLENNPYLQKSTLSEEGKQIKPRRKSPEPPKEALSSYLKERKQVKEFKDILGQLRTVGGTCLESVSVLESKSESESKIKDKDIPAQKEKTGGESVSKPRTPSQNILGGEIEACRKIFAEKFGSGRITEAQICRLAFGANGDKRSCFEGIPVLTEFLKSLKPADCREVEEPFRWLIACAKNPETVERAKKAFFNGAPAKRGGQISTVGEVLTG